MATTYVVLRAEAWGARNELPDAWVEAETQVEAPNAEKACRIVADTMSDDALEDGVTLIAVPARNWTSGRNTFKAETRRRLLKS